MRGEAVGREALVGPAGLALGLVLLVGCREIRVETLAEGTTTVPGGNQIVIVRDAASLGKLGIHAPVHLRASSASSC